MELVMRWRAFGEWHGDLHRRIGVSKDKEQAQGKKGHKKKWLLALVGVVALVAIIIGPLAFQYYFPENDTDGRLKKATGLEDLYTLKQEKDGAHFTQLAQGYALTFPEKPTVRVHPSEAEVDFQLPDYRVRVFKQVVGKNTLPARHYFAYSTGTGKDDFGWLTNTRDHKILRNEDFHLGMQKGRLLVWDRPRLAALSDDARHYCSIDIQTDAHTVMSYLFTAQKPFKNTDALLDLVKSYQAVTPTVQPYVQPLGKTGPQHPVSNKTQYLFDKRFGERANLSWGIFQPSYAAFDYKDLRKTEKELGYRFNFIVHYSDFSRSDPATTIAPVLKQAAAEGRTVELTLQTVDEEDGSNQVYKVLNGKYDGYLKDYAKAIQDGGAPVLLRIGNEMNGDWCKYCAYHLSRDPEIYTAFYRYIADKLTEYGVGDQILYVWNPNNDSWPNYFWNYPGMYYPGDEYVDIIGMTAYNTGTYYPSELWQDFGTLYDETYAHVQAAYRQPVMITEFACSGIGGDKVAWTKEMLKHLAGYKDLKVAIWWNHADYDPKDLETISRSYYIDQPKGMVDVWQDYFQTLPADKGSNRQ